MPRPLRVEYPGARYHVMCRGNRGAVVFADQGDVDLFFKTLGEAAGKTEWRVHAYALMNTHCHDREQRREVSQQAARRAMDQALRARGVSVEELSPRRKGDPLKLAIATYLKHHYRVPNSWISDQLHMGHPSLVGRCQQLVAKDPTCRKLLRDLERELGIT